MELKTLPVWDITLRAVPFTFDLLLLLLGSFREKDGEKECCVTHIAAVAQAQDRSGEVHPAPIWKRSVRKHMETTHVMYNT